MKRFVIVRNLILVFALLLGIIPVNATERPFASSGNGAAAFITDSAGNVVGANLMLSGNGTHLGLFTGTGTMSSIDIAAELQSRATEALERTGGNKQAAANLLGIYRPRLYSKIRKYNIDVASLVSA